MIAAAWGATGTSSRNVKRNSICSYVYTHIHTYIHTYVIAARWCAISTMSGGWQRQSYRHEPLAWIHHGPCAAGFSQEVFICVYTCMFVCIISVCMVVMCAYMNVEVHVYNRYACMHKVIIYLYINICIRVLCVWKSVLFYIIYGDYDDYMQHICVHA